MMRSRFGGLRPLQRTGFCLLLLTAAATGEAAHTYPLFDGRSLAGWTASGGCDVAVRNGMILLRGGTGWLRSHHTYADFTLHVEWKPLEDANFDSGIYIRAAADGDTSPTDGFEIDLREGREGEIAGLAAVDRPVLAPTAGGWSTLDIAVVGDGVSAAINGRHAYEAEGIAIPAGHVGFQVDVPQGGQFLLRNVIVTELGYRTLFDGRDLSEWEGASQSADECWTIRSGVLEGLRKKGPWLRSKEQFGDFNLRLQYRVDPGANSGIYVRIPPDGAHHRDTTSEPPAGFEIQVLDDAARRYGKLKDYQYCGSLYDIAGATRRVGKPAGAWNTLEINCRGHQVAVMHNGEPVVDVEPQKFPLILLRQLKGHLGLQNHGGGVSYRNIRIGDALDPAAGRAP